MSRRSAIRRAASKRYWREADAQVVVQGWRSSGQPLAAFARLTDLNEARLRRWAARLGPARPEAVRFHRVRLTDVASPAAAIEIHVGGCRVVAGAGVRAEDLRQVLLAIREPSAC